MQGRRETLKWSSSRAMKKSCKRASQPNACIIQMPYNLFLPKNHGLLAIPFSPNQIEYLPAASPFL